MAIPSFVFCADLQARESAYRSVRGLKGDDLCALAQVVKYCSDNAVPLILGGDQVDTPTISDEHVIELRRLLSQVQTVRYIDGNHERGFKRLSLEGGPAAVATNLEDSPIQMPRRGLSVQVTGYNWRPRRQWMDLPPESIPAGHICCLHGFCDQVVPALGLPAGDTPSSDIDLSWFDGKFKLVLMGDIHMRWDWTGPKGTRFIYPGSMWMHRLGEPEEKFFVVVNDDDSVTFVPLRCRPFKQAKVSTVDEVKAIQQWVDSLPPDTFDQLPYLEPKQPRIHLTITEAAKDIAPHLAILRQKAIVFEKHECALDQDLNELQGSTAATVDLATALTSLVDPQDAIDQEAATLITEAVATDCNTALEMFKKRIALK